ncbi:MAG: GNAT family N-acetyltransferase [Catenulispora sp.]|nr:GNAT family N-acetyltransferase [Catenulispora sp.]
MAPSEHREHRELTPAANAGKTAANTASSADAVVVRPYADTDAAAIAELYNRHRDAPNFVATRLDAATVRTELAERGTVVFLVAELDGEVLGTVGMFRGTGHRVVGPREVIGDMFFLSPWIRGGAVAGRMFSEAFVALMPLGVGTIRLTVSPVNDRALPLYRQLGCALAGPAGAGEDGNIELVSHLPRLVARMQRDYAHLIPASRRMTAGWRYQADGDTERPPDERVETVSGRRVLRTALVLDGLVFRALLEPETGEILHAEADTGAGPGPDPVLPPAAAAPAAATSRLREGPLVVVLDHGDGSVRVHHDRHVGPVLTQTWPVPGPPYLTGWRRAPRRELRVEPVERASGRGWRVAERYGEATLVRETELTGGLLRQRVYWQGPAPAGRLRTMLVGGLRSGLLFTGDQYVPAGRGLFPVDAIEFGAAGAVLGPDDGPGWWDPGTSLAMRVLRPGSESTSARLIAESLLALDVVPGTEYGIEFSTAQRPGDVVPGASAASAPGYRVRTLIPRQHPDPVVPISGTENTGSNENADIPDSTGRERDFAAARWSPAQVARRPVHRLKHGGAEILLDPAAGGLISWRDKGKPVLATPFPRSRAFARNTAWRAGLWTGRHGPREDPRRGMGWGGPEPERAWRFDPAEGRLVAPDLAWSIEPGADGIRITAEAPGATGAGEPDGGLDGGLDGGSGDNLDGGLGNEPDSGLDGELVVWVTPAAKSAAALVPGAPGETWLLDKSGPWQRWCDRLAVRLDDGRWLYVAADRPGAEILLRATPSGVLLALVTRHPAGQPGTAAWPLTVLDDADAAHRLLVPAPRTELVPTGAAS